jgi:UDP-4-amino-4,6-dideoxy-N-acetyl-beta-L-altrosamine N-acetyltransferase
MLPTDTCTIRPMTSADLQTVLAWRNHPDIRRWMFTQHEIELDEHRQWFERASRDKKRRLLIVEELGSPFGYVQFSNVASDAVSDWGFYAAPEAMAGSGSKLGTAALAFAFQNLRLHKVCGQALDVNDASIGFHRKLGFREEGVLRQQHRVDDRHVDVLCFGLLQREWSGIQTASSI